MVSNVLRPGDKVEIRILQQIEKQKETGEIPHIYKSRVQELNDDGTIDILMPMEEGKYILLHLGVRFEFVFYSGGNLYKGIGTIQERFKSNNIYMLRIGMKTPLSKLQRREYYRFSCVLEFKYYHITGEQMEMKKEEDILDSLRDEDFFKKEKKGMILDISGGGARFVCDEAVEKGEYLLSVLHLVNEKMDKVYYIRSRVLTSTKLEAPEPKFEHRMEFVNVNNHTREDIIRYIFEEERRLRSSEKR